MYVDAHIDIPLSNLYLYIIYIHTHTSCDSLFLSYFSSTQMRVIDGSMQEASFAKLALFSRHPEMKGTNFKTCGYVFKESSLFSSCFMYVGGLLHMENTKN